MTLVDAAVRRLRSWGATDLQVEDGVITFRPPLPLEYVMVTVDVSECFRSMAQEAFDWQEIVS